MCHVVTPFARIQRQARCQLALPPVNSSRTPPSQPRASRRSRASACAILMILKGWSRAEGHRMGTPAASNASLASNIRARISPKLTSVPMI
jgi:hypothetical protein